MSQDGHPTTLNKHKLQLDDFPFFALHSSVCKSSAPFEELLEFYGNKSGAASTHHGGLHRPRLFETSEVISCAVIFPLLALVAEIPSRGQHSRFNSVSGSEG